MQLMQDVQQNNISNIKEEIKKIKEEIKKLNDDLSNLKKNSNTSNIAALRSQIVNAFLYNLDTIKQILSSSEPLTEQEKRDLETIINDFIKTHYDDLLSYKDKLNELINELNQKGINIRVPTNIGVSTSDSTRNTNNQNTGVSTSDYYGKHPFPFSINQFSPNYWTVKDLTINVSNRIMGNSTIELPSALYGVVGTFFANVGGYCFGIENNLEKEIDNFLSKVEKQPNLFSKDFIDKVKELKKALQNPNNKDSAKKIAEDILATYTNTTINTNYLTSKFYTYLGGVTLNDIFTVKNFLSNNDKLSFYSNVDFYRVEVVTAVQGEENILYNKTTSIFSPLSIGASYEYDKLKVSGETSILGFQYGGGPTTLNLNILEYFSLHFLYRINNRTNLNFDIRSSPGNKSNYSGNNPEITHTVNFNHHNRIFEIQGGFSYISHLSKFYFNPDSYIPLSYYGSLNLGGKFSPFTPFIRGEVGVHGYLLNDLSVLVGVGFRAGVNGLNHVSFNLGANYGKYTIELKFNPVTNYKSINPLSIHVKINFW